MNKHALHVYLLVYSGLEKKIIDSILNFDIFTVIRNFSLLILNWSEVLMLQI